MSGALVVGFFIYDAHTYENSPESFDIPVSEYALSPRSGGPKDLPIVEYHIDDDDTPQMRSQKHKPKLVILGTGWGSVALLKQLDVGEYHVTVVSPENHFLFTPMLPSATVGTLELRSLVEPIRQIVKRVRGHFMKASAVVPCKVLNEVVQELKSISTSRTTNLSLALVRYQIRTASSDWNTVTS